jgi:hypothetical protein
VAAVAAEACTAVAPATASGGLPRAGGPSVGVLPPNMSRLSGVVLRYTVYPPGTLLPPPPVVEAATYYSITVDVRAAVPVLRGTESLARPGGVIEAFSTVPLAADLAGHQVELVVSLIGDTRGRRWIMHGRPRPVD